MLNPKQARQVLAALTYAGTTTGQYDYLYAFFATMYYGAVRSAEVNRLREQDCKLPDSGWSELLLEKSASRANARYTDSGETWEVRNLKRCAEGSIRRVDQRRADQRHGLHGRVGPGTQAGPES